MIHFGMTSTEWILARIHMSISGHEHGSQVLRHANTVFLIAGETIDERHQVNSSTNKCLNWFGSMATVLNIEATADSLRA
jgi:hypothetical protein